MKKIIIFLLCFAVLISFNGCSPKTSGKEKGLESMVTAVGFDKTDNMYSIHIEAITINSEEATESEKNVNVITGTGKTLDAAFMDATQKNARPFMFSHCAAAVLSNKISPKYLRDVFRFLYKRKEINLSLRFVSTENAKLLLSCKPVSSIAVGYDLTDAINRQLSFNGINYKNRYYEIEALRKEAVNCFSLPDFKVKEESFENDGIWIYKNDKAVMKLDNESSVIYTVLTENQKTGTVLINENEIGIEKVDIKRKFSFKNQLSTTLTVEFSINKGDFDKTVFKEKSEKLFKESKTLGVDIFMLGNSIKKEERKIWNKISHDYCNIYKNSRLVIKIK